MFTDSELKVKPDVHCQSDDALKRSGHIPAMASSDKKSRAPGPFGVNLKSHRKRVGLTIDALVEKSRVSRSYISSLETGLRKNPSEGMALRLADALQCAVADLWGAEPTTFEDRALQLLRQIPATRREAAIAALYGLAASEAA